MFYVYLHIRKDNGIPFYVGKGHGIRYKQTDRKNIHWKNIVNKYDFDTIFLAENLTELDAFELEKYWIHIAALKGDVVLAISAIKPTKNNCEIKFCLFHSNALKDNQFILNGMLRLCQRIGLFYDFDEMFFARDERKIMINLCNAPLD